MAAKKSLMGVTRTRSGIVIVPAHAAGNAISLALAERDAKQRRIRAMNAAAKKSRGTNGGSQ